MIHADPDQRPSASGQDNARPGRRVLVTAVVVVAGGVLAWWLWPRALPGPPVPPLDQPVMAPTDPVAGPGVRYPVAPPPDEVLTTVLPGLDNSDADLAREIKGLVGAAGFAAWFIGDDLARRFVATVDNLPRRYLPTARLPVRGAPGTFVAAGEPDAPVLGIDNHGRYTPFVTVVERLDAGAAVAVYRRFYPLLQQAYEDRGYPGRYFNDRLIEAIDDLLAAPELAGPVPLARPEVLYEFADPALESRSMGQRIMMRMGLANAGRIKAKLAELRTLLVAS
jgi:hypothetical protein